MTDKPREGAERGALGHLLLAPFDDLQAAMAAALERRPARGVLWLAAAAAASWFVYVPIHELLHAWGCIVTGGHVSELQVDAIYGGALLARIFSFVVVADGPYAGRLTGFDTGGSDAVYLATDFAPYLLTVFVGVPLLRLCARRARPALTGLAAVVALAPFYSATGDYYEMGSIVATRLAGAASGSGLEPWQALRSDDLFALGEALLAEPETWAGTWALVGLGLALGLAFAFATTAAGTALADALLRRRDAPAAAEE